MSSALPDHSSVSDEEGLPMSQSTSIGNPVSQSVTTCATCFLCRTEKPVRIAEKLAVRCAQCNQLVYVRCLLHQFKQTDSDPCRNSAEWLREFIEFSHFQYCCPSCSMAKTDNSCAMKQQVTADVSAQASTVSAKTTVIQSLQPVMDELRKQTDSVDQRVNALSKELLDKMSSLFPTNLLNVASISENSSGSAGVSNAKSDKTGLVSYAHVLSKNITDDISKAVKRVVSESIKEQNNDGMINTSVIVYGMPESKHDLTEVRKLLEDDDDVDSIRKISRLGKPLFAAAHTKSSMRIRPIKVELKSISDYEWVLRNARRLTCASKIRIAKCLSSSELESLRDCRAECARLNESATKCNNGALKYIVINSHIMERAEGGKLIRYQNKESHGKRVETSANVAKPIASSQPKNA